MSTFTSLMIYMLLYMLMQNEGVLGFVDMTCNPTNTAFGQKSVCTCTTDSGSGIAWLKDGTTLMQCFDGGACDVTLADYENGFSTSGTDKVFTITIKSFGYSDCSVFTCKNQDTAETHQETLTVYEFESGAPSSNSEPGAGKNGTIEITTDCLFKESDIVVNWYTVDGGSYEKFTPDGLFQTATTCSDASKVCSSVNAVTLNIGFTHTQKSSKCGQIRVEVYNSVNSSIKLEWTTSDTYCIDEDCTCVCKCICKKMVIAAIVIGIVGAIILPVVIGGTVTEYFGRKTALLVVSIGIVLGVTSFVLGIVVQAKDCCEDDADCCEDDSDCCKEECERNWIENTGAAFIAIGALVGIVAGAIFYLIWSNRMGPGNNGGNGFFCFNNGNDGGDDGGNDGGNNGHHRGHGTNSSTIHSERADTHRGTLSDRRPMPPIPLTDKKGRGLSANYDDEHPMISVGIPDKKAGDLGPLEEESKKKKKKKKKTKNDGDEREKEENKE